MNAERVNKIQGVLFMALFAFAAFYIADFPIFKTTLRISPLIIGIIFGMIYANTLRHNLPEAWVPGIKFSSKTILRTTIVFYGFRLTLTDVEAVGLSAVLVDIVMVTSVVLLGLLIGRLLKLDRDTSILTSTGSAICGAAAVLGTEPVLGGKPNKTVIAVSTVVIFGTLSMFLYPMFYRMGLLDGMTVKQVGVYTGSTLHEVAHVAGAGAAMGDPFIAATATITKMIRVILLAPYLVILGFVVKPLQSQTSLSVKRKVQIPWFAVWFLVMIGVNTLLQIGADAYGFRDGYDATMKVVEWFDNFGLTMAMVALGTDASIAKFKEAGFKPFLLALILFFWLLFAGYWVVKFIA